MKKKRGIYHDIALSTRRVARKLKHDVEHVPKKQALGIAIVFSIICIVVIGVLMFEQVSDFVNIPAADDQKGQEDMRRICETNEDCVANSCCHAFRCTNKEYAPSCIGIACTEECQPGTLDCGQGHCACVNGLCEAYIDNP